MNELKWWAALVAAVASGGCGGGLNQTVITCPADRTLLDGVCVAEAIADYVACVRAQGAQLGADKSQSISADVGYLGVNAGGAAEVSESLEKKYSVSDAATLEIIRSCNGASGLPASSAATTPTATVASPTATAATPQPPVDETVKWVADSRGHVPEGAQVGGHEYGSELVVCRGEHHPATKGGYPEGAVKGGHEEGHPLVLCRAAHGGGVHPGKIVGDSCCIGWGGKEVYAADYEVLMP